MLIIDMPMPVNCMSCPFSSGCSFCEGYDDYCVLAPKDAKYEWNFSDGKEPKERPDWCPIKGELPEEHGDLIDRTLLFADLVGVILSHSGLNFSEVIARQDAVIAAERKDNEQIH